MDTNVKPIKEILRDIRESGKEIIDLLATILQDPAPEDIERYRRLLRARNVLVENSAAVKDFLLDYQQALIQQLGNDILAKQEKQAIIRLVS